MCVRVRTALAGRAGLGEAGQGDRCGIVRWAGCGIPSTSRWATTRRPGRRAPRGRPAVASRAAPGTTRGWAVPGRGEATQLPAWSVDDGNRDGNPVRQRRSRLNPHGRTPSENALATRPPPQLESGCMGAASWSRSAARPIVNRSSERPPAAGSSDKNREAFAQLRVKADE